VSSVDCFVCSMGEFSNLKMSLRFFEPSLAVPRASIGFAHAPRGAAWPDCDAHRQNEIRPLDSDKAHSFNQRSSGVSTALVGQEGIRCVSPLLRRAKSGAAPATVGGESFSRVPLGLVVQGLGRRRRAATREPGDLPERSHPSVVRGARSGRTSAVVTNGTVARGCCHD
jgi:hypothetical protein